MISKVLVKENLNNKEIISGRKLIELLENFDNIANNIPERQKLVINIFKFLLNEEYEDDIKYFILVIIKDLENDYKNLMLADLVNYLYKGKDVENKFFMFLRFINKELKVNNTAKKAWEEDKKIVWLACLLNILGVSNDFCKIKKDIIKKLELILTLEEEDVKEKLMKVFREDIGKISSEIKAGIPPESIFKSLFNEIKERRNWGSFTEYMLYRTVLKKIIEEEMKKIEDKNFI